MACALDETRTRYDVQHARSLAAADGVMLGERREAGSVGSEPFVTAVCRRARTLDDGLPALRASCIGIGKRASELRWPGRMLSPLYRSLREQHAIPPGRLVVVETASETRGPTKRMGTNLNYPDFPTDEPGMREATVMLAVMVREDGGADVIAFSLVRDPKHEPGYMRALKLLADQLRLARVDVPIVIDPLLYPTHRSEPIETRLMARLVPGDDPAAAWALGAADLVAGLKVSKLAPFPEDAWKPASLDPASRPDIPIDGPDSARVVEVANRTHEAGVAMRISRGTGDTRIMRTTVDAHEIDALTRLANAASELESVKPAVADSLDAFASRAALKVGVTTHPALAVRLDIDASAALLASAEPFRGPRSHPETASAPRHTASPTQS